VHDKRVAAAWLTEQGVEDTETAMVLAGGGPLLALSSLQDDWHLERQQVFKSWQSVILGTASIARSAETISEISTRRCLQYMSAWVADIVKLGVDGQAPILSPDLRCELTELSTRRTPEQWFTLYDRLLHLHRSDSASFKTQAVLEGIFADIRLDS